MTHRQQLVLFAIFFIIASTTFVASIVRTQTKQISQQFGTTQPTPLTQNYYQQIHASITRSDYQLAYPGLLPTHPLYNIKMARDRVRLTLAREPVQKTALLLLYADKRLASAEILVMQGKIDPAVTVATKGMDYYRQTLLSAKLLPSAIQTSLFYPLTQSSLKYEEILEKMKNVTTGSANNQVNKLLHDLDLNREMLQP